MSEVVARRSADLENWRLPWPESGRPAKTMHWTVRAAYASAIACALNLEALGTNLSDEGVDDLRRLLRTFRMLAYDRGHVRPVLGVIKCGGKVDDRLRELVENVEWHQGSFILFPVEDPQVLLSNLLAPDPKPWDAASLLKDPGFTAALNSSSVAPSNSLFSCLVQHATDVERDPEELASVIAKWTSDKTAAARLLEDSLT